MIFSIASFAACQGCRGCPHYPLEVVIAVDVSRGVTDQDLKNMKLLVSYMVGNISISESTCPSGARVAVISYASSVQTLVRFSDYHTKKKLAQLVDRDIVRDGSEGGRNMGEAMMYTARNMFKRIRSGKLVKKMAIFLTAGPPVDRETVLSAVVELGAQEIIPVIVTIGGVNVDSLRQAFSDCPGRYEIISQYTEPDPIHRLKQCFFCYDVCRPDPACKVGDSLCLADMGMDVAFLLDSSGVSAGEFEKARDFLDATVDLFSQPCSARPRVGARLALVQQRRWTFSGEDPVEVEFDFAQFRTNKTKVKQHIKDSLRQLQGSSVLGQGLEYIMEGLFRKQSKAGRTKVIFTILGTKSHVQDHRQLAEVTLKAKCQGYILFTLALGRGASISEIAHLSSPAVSYHSCQFGIASETDVEYALRYIEYFFTKLPQRLKNYPPQSLQEQCKAHGRDFHLSDSPWTVDPFNSISANVTSTPTHCLQSKDHGVACKRSPGVRWFYRNDTKSCSIFWYNGCSGNENRFLTKEICLQHCNTQRLRG
ncbi:hypothetical protein MATL_G00133250 [Megalops atlanticus]|uniref:Uncharacterized protein n=1 Tax=Megalops atlanticus TaxID=7932 RepID=A0A9D3TC51_MEGAT|nr:hypothetical protein MATL_G00133250 [Megalops atlanticus]